MCWGRHQSATENIYGDITAKGGKGLIGHCSICNRKKSMTVSDNTIVAEHLGDLFKNLAIKGPNVSKNLAKNVLKNRGRALDITANIPTAAARNPEAGLSTLPHLITFYNAGRGSKVGRFVRFFTTQMEQKKDRLYPSAPLENKNNELEQTLKNYIV